MGYDYRSCDLAVSFPQVEPLRLASSDINLSQHRMALKLILLAALAVASDASSILREAKDNVRKQMADQIARRTEVIDPDVFSFSFSFSYSYDEGDVVFRGVRRLRPARPSPLATEKPRAARVDDRSVVVLKIRAAFARERDHAQAAKVCQTFLEELETCALNAGLEDELYLDDDGEDDDVVEEESCEGYETGPGFASACAERFAGSSACHVEWVDYAECFFTIAASLITSTQCEIFSCPGNGDEETEAPTAAPVPAPAPAPTPAPAPAPVTDESDGATKRAAAAAAGLLGAAAAAFLL